MDLETRLQSILEQSTSLQQDFTPMQRDVVYALKVFARSTMLTDEIIPGIEYYLSKLGYQVKVSHEHSNYAGQRRELISENEIKYHILPKLKLNTHSCLGNITLRRDGCFSNEEISYLDHVVGEVVADILDHADLYHDMMHSLEYLSRLNKLIAHEIRAPLASNHGYVSLIQGDLKKLEKLLFSSPDPETVQNLLNSINNAAQKALINNEFMNTLLGLLVESGINYERTHRNMEEVQVLEYLGNIIAKNDAFLKNKNLGLLVYEQNVRGRSMAINRTYFDRILDNVVGNAIKYTPPGNDIKIKVGGEEELVVIVENPTRSVLSGEFSAHSRDFPVDHGLNQGLGLSFIGKLIKEGYNGSMVFQFSEEPTEISGKTYRRRNIHNEHSGQQFLTTIKIPYASLQRSEQ